MSATRTVRIAFRTAMGCVVDSIGSGYGRSASNPRVHRSHLADDDRSSAKNHNSLQIGPLANTAVRELQERRQGIIITGGGSDALNAHRGPRRGGHLCLTLGGRHRAAQIRLLGRELLLRDMTSEGHRARLRRATSGRGIGARGRSHLGDSAHGGLHFLVYELDNQNSKGFGNRPSNRR
eukprot:9466075-Pyramimonas_sp.AAC.2